MPRGEDAQGLAELAVLEGFERCGGRVPGAGMGQPRQNVVPLLDHLDLVSRPPVTHVPTRRQRQRPTGVVRQRSSLYTPDQTTFFEGDNKEVQYTGADGSTNGGKKAYIHRWRDALKFAQAVVFDGNMIGGTAAEAKDIADPLHSEYPRWEPMRTLHADGANYLFSDDHVQYIKAGDDLFKAYEDGLLGN